MKKALVALYIIVVAQAVATAIAFSRYQSAVSDGIALAGMEMVGFCDNRYVHQK